MIEEIFPISVNIENFPKQKALGPLPKKAEKIPGLGEGILMSTHNIGFYEDLTKITFELSSNTHIISSAGKSVFRHFYQVRFKS